MIYVLSLNPSLDYHLKVDSFKVGETNRSVKEFMQIGGKGINVSVLLNNLNTKTQLLGFVGGNIGNIINQKLNAYPYIQNNMISTEADSRINIKINSDMETEINARGNPITSEELLNLENQLQDIEAQDFLIITGSLAANMKTSWYLDVAKKMQHCHLVFDIASKILLEICPYHPFLIKPNLKELEAIFEVNITNQESILYYGKKLVQLGAQNCIISMGNQGSYLITQDKVYQAQTPQGKLVNSVGAGDTMIGAFIYAYQKEKDIEKAYAFSVAASSATAYTEHIATQNDIEALINNVKIGEYHGS